MQRGETARAARAAAESAGPTLPTSLLAARTDRSGLFIFHASRVRVESVRRVFDSARLFA
ncbi:hypothetical protein CO709_20385 [Burkholderia thailandensis]|nr:hypothetical protein CO709_20385 [Burkholderia thailandensis]